MVFGEKLQKLIDGMGWTQKRLADTVGVDGGTVSNWLKTARPKLDETSVRLAQALRVSLDYLADDGLDEMPAASVAGVSEDDRFVLRAVHALNLDGDEAVRRLYLERAPFRQVEPASNGSENAKSTAR